MKKPATRKVRGSDSQTAAKPGVLLVGTGRFGKGLGLNQFVRFCVATQDVIVSAVERLDTESQLAGMQPPFVVVLGLSESAYDALLTIRRVWPYTSVIIAADETRLAEVYPLLVSGAADFLPLSASNDVVEEACLLQLGVHQAKLKDSSRTIGKLTVDFAHRTVTNGTETAHLTPIEVNILRTLVDSFGSVVEREKVKAMCWGDAEITDNALNRKIYEVRRTLRRLSQKINIRTIYGLGFELQILP